MKLKELESLGGFVSEVPVEKEIRFTLDDGEEKIATIHIKRLSVGEYERLIVTKDDTHGHTAKLISEAVRFGDGKEKISVERAFRLHKSLAEAMINAVGEVNRGKKG